MKVLLALCLPCLALAAAAAPAAAADPSPPAATDQALQLSPFEVNETADTGYTATNSLAGGRTNMPLMYAPAAVSELTQQFLQDIGATSFDSADLWSVNYTPQPDIMTVGTQGKSVNYRNLGTTYVSRNYFLWYIQSDSYNVDRYEEARGPNGVLFGDGGAAGVATTFTKQAHFGNATHEAEAFVNSLGGTRFTADWNQPLNDQVALRVNLLNQNGQFEYRDFTHWDRHAGDIAATIKVDQRDSVRLDTEVGDWEKSIYPNYIVDQGSLWNHTSAYSGTAIPTPTPNGVQAIAAASSNIDVNGTLANWTGFFHSIGVGNAVNLLPTGQAFAQLLHAPALPHKGFNYQPTDIEAEGRYYTWSAYWDHEFSSDLHSEVSYAVQRQTVDTNGDGSHNFFNLYQYDVNTILPGGAANPNYGQLYTDSQPEKVRQENLTNELRGALSWEHDFGWLSQSISLVGGTRMDRFHGFASQYRVLASGANVFVRRYWNQAGQAEGDLAFPGVDFVTTTQNWQRKAIDYGQAQSVSQFFNKRLTILGGLRYDKLYNSQYNALTNVKTIQHVAPTSRNVGAVYYFVPWLGALANYSETFQPPNSGNPLLDGTPPGFSRATGEDYGLKLNLFGGKISGSLRYYTSEQLGILQAGNNVAEVNTIWAELNKPQNDIAAYRDTADLKGSGYEAEMTGNPAANLRIMFNYAIPKVTNLNVEPQLKAYVAANLATWQAAAVTDPTVATNLSTITTRLNGLVVGAVNPGTYKYTANLLAAYNFPSTRLKGITVGGGANFRGPAVVGNYPGQPFNYVYTPSYYLLTAFARYKYKFSRKVTGSFQVNVTNLLNNDALIAEGVANITTAGNLPAGVGSQFLTGLRISDPREATFSSTFDF